MAIACLACAFALGGCSVGQTGTPEESFASATPRPFFTTGAQLAAYAKERRAALQSEAAENPDNLVRGALTLARPLPFGELDSMLKATGIQSNYYFEWIEPGTEVSGAANRMQAADVLRDYPGLRVTYVNAEAKLATLLALGEDARVWLIDVGGTENYYNLALSTGLIR